MPQWQQSTGSHSDRNLRGIWPDQLNDARFWTPKSVSFTTRVRGIRYVYSVVAINLGVYNARHDVRQG
jgi:hypothetical protein